LLGSFDNGKNGSTEKNGKMITNEKTLKDTIDIKSVSSNSGDLLESKTDGIDVVGRQSSEVEPSSIISKDNDALELDALLGSFDNGENGGTENEGNMITKEEEALKDTIDTKSAGSNNGDLDESKTEVINVVEKKSSTVEPSSVISEDDELDAILGNGNGDLFDHDKDKNAVTEKNNDLVNHGEYQFKNETENDSFRDLNSPVTASDKFALELDALLNDSDEEDGDAKANFEIIEEPSNPVVSNKKKKLLIDTSMSVGNGVSKVRNSTRMMLFGSPEKARNQKNSNTIHKKHPAECKKKVSDGRRDRESVNNNGSSISASLLQSKKAIATTRDRLKEKIGKFTTRGNDKKDNTLAPLLSSTTKRSYLSPTVSSTKKFGWRAPECEKKTKPRSFFGDNENKIGFRHYMKSTVNFTNKVLETKAREERKTKSKETNAKKIIVNLTPWKNKPYPTTVNFDDYDVWRRESSPLSTTVSNNRKWASPMTPGTGSRNGSPKSYAEQSVGSLSSQCTVESFVSPSKAGIIGCQKKYEPFLHNSKGPCELCVFRLSETERDKLDAQGRHLLVQFTTGGCRDCSVFPKAVGEVPVRLCNKCHSVSHRQVQTRRRKRGNNTAIGYSFAKISEGKI